MSKNVRWTIYTAIIIGIMGGGYYLTFTKSPDTYTPRQLPAHMEETLERERQQKARQQQQDQVDDDQVDDDQSSWTIELSGTIEEVRLLHSEQEADSYISLTIDHEFGAATDGDDESASRPTLHTPIRAVGLQTMITETLERPPKPGDRIIIESHGQEDQPGFLTIDDLRFADGN